MNAEIISIGTELITGEVIDSNANFIASQLQLIGVRVRRITVAGDQQQQLRRIMKQALKRSQLLVISGGLGPTEDDLTRQCLADAMGEKLFIDSRLETELRSFFAKLGRDMPPHNLKQATLIPSAESMKNKLGTAPGWWLEKGDKVVIALPGPPRELIPMWQQEVLRRLKSKLTSATITTRTIKTYGLSEAKVSELVTPLFRSDNPSLGIYAKPDGISLRLIAYGMNAAELLANAEQKLVEILGDHIWGRDDDDLIKIVSDLLTGNKYSLGTMEDGTGGIIASMISNTEQAHHYYYGGVIAKSSEAKTRLGIPHELVRKCGGISEDLARQMALVIKETLPCDIGLSTTGITGLDTVDRASIKHAYIGIADRGGTISWRQNILPHPDIARNRLATAALFRLRQRLLSKGNTA